MEEGEKEIIHLSLHCYRRNDTSIQMGSDERHFNVSLIVGGQSHKTMSVDHNF